MDNDLYHRCDQHPDRFECPDALIVKNESDYGIIIHNGGESYAQINFCPWCGSKLKNASGARV
jgi:hypothetical protein